MRAHPGVTAHCTFLYLRFRHCCTIQHLFIYSDYRHPNRSGTTYINPPKTPNPFLGIYPKEIIGQVQKVVWIKRIFITQNGEKLDQPKYPTTANWLNKL